MDVNSNKISIAYTIEYDIIKIKVNIEMRRKLRRIERKKRHKKILLSSLLITCLLSVGYGAFQTTLNINATGKIKQTDFYVSSSGSDTNGNGTKENPYLTIEKAYEKAGKKATIYIMTDIRPSKQIVFDKEKTITIASYSENSENNKIIKDENYKSDLTNVYNDYLLKITKGKIILKNITLYGSDLSCTGGGILIYNSSVLELLSNTEISNFKATQSNGTAIRIQPITVEPAQHNNLIIDGAIIKDNINSVDGGAIFVNFSTKFTMKNGTIINNEAKNGGAIVNFGETYLHNGIINNNVAKNSGGGIFTAIHKISDIQSSKGIVNIYGTATISNNSANIGGALYIEKNAYLTMNGGIISNNTATSSVGGIYKHENGTFNYNSGIICENTPPNEYETHASCPN